MQYLKMQHLQQGMHLAKAIMGDDGRLLLNKGNVISNTILQRMGTMGFQGAYIETAGFEDIEVEDVIPDEVRAAAFQALYSNDIVTAVNVAKKIVEGLKYKETLKMDLLDIKNDKNYVYRHSVSVAVFSVVIGIGCGLRPDHLDDLAVAGLLHDIGKLMIKKKVLNAKHLYNEKEMDEMKKHPMNGYEILKDYPGISSVTRNSILFHHENLDGSGYYGIGEEKLGVFPRILRVADTYDALTAQKKYRDASSPSEAIEYLMSHVDTLFDRQVVEVFVKKVPVYPMGFTLRLSNNEIVVVVSNAENSLRPIVRRIDGKEINLSEDPEYRSILIKEIM